MAKYENRIVTNRKSPTPEQDYIDAYLSLNPKAARKDHLDVSAVIAKDGTRGHALMNESFNRSKDRDRHVGYDFIPDKELKKHMK